MRRVPHRLIEGCLIAAHAIEADRVFIYVRGEYLTEYEILQAAVDEARQADIFGPCDILVHRGAGAYICGEETALLDSLEGRRGQPRPRPPFPPVQGLYDAPTQINNVCTIATVPIIIELGAAEFAKIGPESSPGTAIFSISATSSGPATTSSSSAHRCASSSTTSRAASRRPAAEVRHPRRLVRARADARPARHAARLRLDPGRRPFFGAASLIVVDDRCCMVQLALRAAKFYMHESCGKCTPCREGTRWMVQLLEKIEAGDASHADIDLLESVCRASSGARSARSATSPSTRSSSFMRKFPDEFRAHVDRGSCPFGDSSTLDGILAPSDVHVHQEAEPVPA